MINWNSTDAITEPPRLPPGPPGYPLLGHLPQMRRNILQFLTEAVRQYGDVILLRMGPRHVYLFCDPGHIAHILQYNHRNYGKSQLTRRLKPFLGEGLATSEGDHWKRQRRLAQPAFHRQQVASLAEVVTNTTAELLETWRPLAENEQPFDLLKEMMQLTGSIIVKAMFGASISGTGGEFVNDITIVTQYSLERILAVTDCDFPLPTPKKRRFQKALHRLDRTVWNMIDTRRRSGENHGDLLSMLLQAREADTDMPMNDQQLRDEVMTIFFAGHETTGLALTWTWYLLATHPQVEHRLRSEVRNVLKGRVPTFEDISRLMYTRMVLQESLRLYPPAWVISRAPIADDEIGGYVIPSGSPVLISQYITHRHPKLWENPEEFDPERFTPERSANRPSYAYFPFSGGPRQCIGEQFAMMEAQLVVAMVAQTYQVQLMPGQQVEPQPLLTLRPSHGLHMTLKKRPFFPQAE